MEILELGSGWGSLSRWMAEKYPNSRVVTVSNSRPQGEFIKARCAALKLNNVEVISADMNDFHIDQTTYSPTENSPIFSRMREMKTGWGAISLLPG
jgi:cyclopropane fatty-acyl-phospholipid synthase-like methyltransferase